MSSSILLRRQSKTSPPHILSSLTFLRFMGGGPRTFPGGLNKWQWKRLHEKKAREKEKNLLEHEKQIYQARIRSQIRAQLDGQPGPERDPKHSPMTADDHIKALADRFMKAGAEDLWNKADGPIRSDRAVGEPTRKNRSIRSPIDVRKLISESDRNPNSTNLNDSTKPRYYSVCKDVPITSPTPNNQLIRWPIDLRKLIWESERTKNSMNFNDSVKARGYSVNARSQRETKFKFRRNESSEDDSDLDGGGFGGGEAEEVKGRGMASGAALGKYDKKKTRRVPLQFLEEEDYLSEHVAVIRNEVKKRISIANAVDKSDEDSILSQKRFDECNVSPLTVTALTQAGYVQMTRVQEATLSVCLEGKDALVKAKTGTGKSAAFLLPAIETVLKASSSNTVQRVQPIYVLVICPTRELASQIAAEATVLLRYHDGIGVQTLVGGTRFKVDQKRLESEPCQMIVATPGRLLDHIENKSGFSARLMGLKMLILDEADHLLDLGFRKDMEKLVDCLPRERQSLLFSATIPKEVRRISHLVLKREHAYVDTVGLGCVETHDKVKQFSLVAPHELHFQIVHHLLHEHISQTVDYKVIVFCTTAMVTSLVFLLLREMKLNVREIHTRKPQLYRTRISDEFREAKRLILVTSDVSARGMNYPDVTLVLQMGIPSDREQYIHRLGRTGREGKGGEGILLLAPWEQYFLGEIKDLPIQKFPLPQLDSDTKIKVENSLAKIDTSMKEAAYHAWLGYYNSVSEIGRDKTTLVELANQFCQSIGLERPPGLFRKTALKMGLKDIPGIRIRKT
ncbi:probable DEAD-box ATP-dependent RNA helicase 48 isoform X1 [Actinidia eriantha]|uniref:probable DEAD-box ATP-dependent RNA helicase 48 isoform X1 n=1 Tax=Actinidia eriantha TaxID=165200 RepID=UPI00258C6124|nr:probable DEAD-box ATP-dependent RNA helicase 48 isoform X1 [Actinidia eriantha]